MAGSGFRSLTAAACLLVILSAAAASSPADDKKALIAQEMAAGSKCDMRSDKGLREYVQYLTNVIDLEPDADMYFSVLQKRASALQVPPRPKPDSRITRLSLTPPAGTQALQRRPQ